MVGANSIDRIIIERLLEGPRKSCVEMFFQGSVSCRCGGRYIRSSCLHSVVFFDHVEKSNHDLINILYQDFVEILRWEKSSVLFDKTEERPAVFFD